MDELLTLFLKTHKSLEEFDEILCQAKKNIIFEIENSKDNNQTQYIKNLIKDISDLERLQISTISQTKAYIKNKIGLLKIYFNEE